MPLIAKRVTLLQVFLAMLAVVVLLRLTGLASGLAALLTLCLVPVGFTLGYRFIRYCLRRSIWALRNRLIITYLFIGAVPVILLVILAGIGTWIVVGQVATFMVTSELDRRVASLASPTRFFAGAKQSDLPAVADQIVPLLRDRLPGLQVVVRGRKNFTYPENASLTQPAGLGDYNGFVQIDGRIFCWSSVSTPDGTQAIIAAPVSSELLSRLVTNIGMVSLAVAGRPARTKKTPIRITVDGQEMEVNTASAGRVPPPYNILDIEIPWTNPIPVLPSSKEKYSADLIVATRPSAVLGAVFGSRFETAQNVLLIFIAVASMLLIAELISLVIGISLTRTITGAVHDLYAGTRKIAQGDFSHRIPVRGGDQLADLGKSFNEMTEQLETLVVIAKEKERMESELEIAREVQRQLFPRSTPRMKTIELTGVCNAARMVSGDYYDYLCLPDGNLAVAIGDVAGKGISAALLMASIQSIMRTQLAAGLPMSAAVGNGGSRAYHSTSGIVAQLNRQLFASTSPEKYATFFFGIYDEKSRFLSYTNAGHLPPLLVSKGEVTPLEVTGTVVGAFPNLTYGEDSVYLGSGDLFVAYTDGITEPENAYGEEFGDQRLSEAILRNQNRAPDEIIAKIMEAVSHWSNAPELPDDMTVVIARGMA